MKKSENIIETEYKSSVASRCSKFQQIYISNLFSLAVIAFFFRLYDLQLNNNLYDDDDFYIERISYKEIKEAGGENPINKCTSSYPVVSKSQISEHVAQLLSSFFRSDVAHLSSTSVNIYVITRGHARESWLYYFRGYQTLPDLSLQREMGPRARVLVSFLSLFFPVSFSLPLISHLSDPITAVGHVD